MEKSLICTIVNLLLEALLVPKVLAEFNLQGYRTEMIVGALLGIIIGAILALKYPLRNAIYWLLVGVALLSLEMGYDQILIHANYIPPFEAWAMLLMLLLFFTGLAYLLLPFELWVVAALKKKE